MQALNNIKNIIFDLGRVLLNIHPPLVKQAFKDYGGENTDETIQKLIKTAVFEKFETGNINTAEFRNILRKYSDIALTDEQIDNAWNKMLLDIPPERIKLLTALKKRYRLLLLSNTNEIHVKCLNGYLSSEYGINSLAAYFDDIFYSYQTGFRKPDIRIYEYVIQHSGIIPEETVFIDDKEENINSAKKTGLKGLLLPAEMDLIDLIKNKLVV